MKAQIKAIVASAVVIALCLAAVGGVTYSWFSDSENAEIEVSAAEIDLNLISVSGTASSAGMGSNIIIDNTANFPIGGSVTVNANAFSSSSTLYDISVKNMAPGDSLDLTISGTLKNTISTWIDKEIIITEGGSEVANDCLLTSTTPVIKIDNNTLTNPVIAGDETKNITISTTISLDESADNTYQNRTFNITLAIDVVQQNRDHAAYQATVPDNGTINITADNSTTSFTSTGIDGITSGDIVRIDVKSDSTTATISDYGFQIGNDAGTPLAALDLTLTKNGGTTGGTTISNFGESSITVTVPAPAGLNTDPGAFTVKYVGEPSLSQPSNISYNSSNNTISFTTTHFSKFVIMNNAVTKVQNLTTGKFYDTFANAIGGITDNDHYDIMFYGDLSGNGIKILEGRNITIDLNGYTYTMSGATVGSNGTETNAFQLLKNSTITFKNGTITTTTEAHAKILIQNYCNLTLSNMTVDGSSIIGSYVLSNNNGDISINDTKIVAPTNKYAMDVYGNFLQYTGPNVSVSGYSIIKGKIQVAVEPVGTQYRGENCTKHSLTINENVLFDEVEIDSTNSLTSVRISNSSTGTINNNVSGFEITRF